MRIEVTQEDINKGQPISASFCPVALACKRAFNLNCSVVASQGVTVYLDENNRKKYHIPYVARKFIIDFDHCQPVKPFTFELEEK